MILVELALVVQFANKQCTESIVTFLSMSNHFVNPLSLQPRLELWVGTCMALSMNLPTPVAEGDQTPPGTRVLVGEDTSACESAASSILMAS